MAATALSAYKAGQKSARGRSRGRSRKGVTLPLAVVAGFAPLAIQVYEGWNRGGFPDVANVLSYNLTGYHFMERRWDPKMMVRGWAPILFGLAVHKIVGGRMGLNRSLTAAGIPFIRI